MGILNKIRRHAAIATGDFESIFKGTKKMASLPVAASRLIAEINNPEPSITNLEKIFLAEPGLAARVLQVVNSSLFGMSTRVTNVKQAISLLGLRRIREIALTYSVLDGLPKVDLIVFNREALWADSLIMGILARSFGKRFRPGSEEDAFTSALLSHMALPVLLTSWTEYYAPVIEEWAESPDRLSEIERAHFGWDHGQAGAWLAKGWNFPDDMICFIGSHNLSIDELKEHKLLDTVALPVALSGMAPSILKSESDQSRILCQCSKSALQMGHEDYLAVLEELRVGFADISELFQLADIDIDSFVDRLADEASCLRS